MAAGNQRARSLIQQQELSGEDCGKRQKYGGAPNPPDPLCCTWGLRHTHTGFWSTSHASLSSSTSTLGKILCDIRNLYACLQRWSIHFRNALSNTLNVYVIVTHAVFCCRPKMSPLPQVSATWSHFVKHSPPCWAASTDAQPWERHSHACTQLPVWVTYPPNTLKQSRLHMSRLTYAPASTCL